MKIELINDLDYRNPLKVTIELTEIASYSESLLDTFNGLKQTTKIILKSGEKITVSKDSYKKITEILKNK